jgi:hypothetical protein
LLTRGAIEVTTQTKERIRIFLHRDQEIVSADYSGLSGEGLLSQIRRNHSHLSKLGVEKGEKSLLLVSDFRDTELDSEIMWALKDLASALDPYLRASALLGFSDVRRFSINVLNTIVSVKRRAFASRDDALDWLVSQGSENSS